jgi:hypothetical protein
LACGSNVEGVVGLGQGTVGLDQHSDRGSTAATTTSTTSSSITAVPTDAASTQGTRARPSDPAECTLSAGVTKGAVAAFTASFCRDLVVVRRHVAPLTDQHRDRGSTSISESCGLTTLASTTTTPTAGATREDQTTTTATTTATSRASRSRGADLAIRNLILTLDKAAECCASCSICPRSPIPAFAAIETVFANRPPGSTISPGRPGTWRAVESARSTASSTLATSVRTSRTTSATLIRVSDAAAARGSSACSLQPIGSRSSHHTGYAILALGHDEPVAKDLDLDAAHQVQECSIGRNGSQDGKPVDRERVRLVRMDSPHLGLDDGRKSDRIADPGIRVVAAVQVHP